MDISDPDVQEELDAMANASKQSIFGAVRFSMPQNRPNESRSIKPPPQTTFSMDNNLTAENVHNTGAPSNQLNRSLSPPPPVVLSNIERATKVELETILKKPALTPEEKFLALDARDKLIRLTTARNVDIKKAASIKGNCPDMCPEKERLSRIAKHRVASFELEEGSKIMNHSIAVKEYSRSSADQETPLCHELRPESVLKLTMTYLLQKIMGLCDVSETNIGDWFQFLWDRTRSIRKDITQQELCSPGTVLLIEQCARFHIHCAARLVNEEPQVFDQKINTENLTKCLQSLKYMYHDLGLKGIRCPNEAEFRAYVVLLNLHDSNFLWEVKQLPDDILRSPEIQFAIKIYLAIESNNYVRFFSLVRSTTYMNACILLRYFTQVRVKALKIMFKAYTVRNPVYITLSNITYLLAFEDLDQCAEFLEYYGLRCDRAEDRFILDRNTFFLPDMPFVLDRAYNIVEHKRQSNVGDIIHGCPLDSKSVLEQYIPHNSFDENGLLIPEAWAAIDKNYGKSEARSEVRQNKSRSRDDDNVFKMPTAPPRSSPKSRLSPKNVTISESNASQNTVTPFGSNRFTSIASSDTNNIFKKSCKTNASAEADVFGFGFGYKRENTHNDPKAKNLFGDGSIKSVNSFTSSQRPDTTDGNQFKSSNNSSFVKPAQNMISNSNNIFSSKFSQNTNASTNIFAQAGSQATIFSGFTNNATTNQISNASIFGTPNQASSIFGGDSKMNFPSMPGIKPLTENAFSVSKTTQQLENDARMEEQQRKRKEAEELERKKKAEIVEKERQRKLDEERREREQRKLEQKKRAIDTKSQELSERILEEYVQSSLTDLAKHELEHHHMLMERIQQIYADLSDEVIDTELEKIAIDVKSAWDKNILEKYFVCWRRTARKRIEQRQKIENTPQWIPNKPMNEIIPGLYHPLQTQTLSLMKRYRSGFPCKLRVPPIREDNIDVWKIIAPELNKLMDQLKKCKNIYWKCVISLPDNEEDSFSQSISHWLNSVFVRQLSIYPKRNDIFFLEQSMVNGNLINVCMRTISGTRMINESQKTYETKDIDGSNAILFFVTNHNLNITRARLKAVLKAIQLNDAAGIIIYNFGSSDPNELKGELRLHELLDTDKVDECVFANSGSNGLCYSTKHCLRYIAENSFYDDQLEMQKIIPFLSTCLSDELWQRISISINGNPTLLEASTHFDFLIGYHNAAIEHLISMVSPNCFESPTLFSHELRQFVPKHHLDIPLGLEYFPEDWHKHAEKHQNQMHDFLKSLIIKPQLDLKTITDATSLEQEILKFVTLHIASQPHAQRITYKIIQNIFATIKPPNDDADRFKKKIASHSWLHSLPIFTAELLSYQYNRFVSEKRLPNYVIYDRHEFLDYSRNAWWLTLNENLLKDLTAHVIRKIDDAIDEYEQSVKRQKLDETTIIETEKIDLEQTLARGYASLTKADKNFAKFLETNTMRKDISRDLDYSLYRNEQTIRDTKEILRNFK